MKSWCEVNTGATGLRSEPVHTLCAGGSLGPTSLQAIHPFPLTEARDDEYTRTLTRPPTRSPRSSIQDPDATDASTAELADSEYTWEARLVRSQVPPGSEGCTSPTVTQPGPA